MSLKDVFYLLGVSLCLSCHNGPKGYWWGVFLGGDSCPLRNNFAINEKLRYNLFIYFIIQYIYINI